MELQLVVLTDPFSKIVLRFEVNMRHNEQVPGRDWFFLLHSSINRCKEEIRVVASKRIKILVLYALQVKQEFPAMS